MRLVTYEHAGRERLYARWPEGFTVAGGPPAPLEDFRGRRCLPSFLISVY